MTRLIDRLLRRGVASVGITKAGREAALSTPSRIGVSASERPQIELTITGEPRARLEAAEARVASARDWRDVLGVAADASPIECRQAYGRESSFLGQIPWHLDPELESRADALLRALKNARLQIPADRQTRVEGTGGIRALQVLNLPPEVRPGFAWIERESTGDEEGRLVAYVPHQGPFRSQSDVVAWLHENEVLDWKVGSEGPTPEVVDRARRRSAREQEERAREHEEWAQEVERRRQVSQRVAEHLHLAGRDVSFEDMGSILDELGVDYVEGEANYFYVLVLKRLRSLRCQRDG
jgi:hypothetical protein